MSLKTTKDLPCKLTPEQLAEKRAKAAEHGLSFRDIEDRIADLKKLSKAEMDALAALAKQVRDGTETRPVKCIEKKEYELDEVHTIRTDTKEVVERRKMTLEDRQQNLGETTAKGGKRTIDPAAAEGEKPGAAH